MLTISADNGISGLWGINGSPVQRSANLTNLLYPSIDAGHRDTYRSGWLPYWFNQQWGGSQWGNLPDGSNGDIATGNIQDDVTFSMGLIAGATHQQQAMGFKVSENQTPAGVLVKLSKGGSPTDNVQVQCWSDSAGLPSGALGTLAAISGRQITSKTDGEWYFFPVTFPALMAGTQYHIVVSRSGAGDNANLYGLKGSTNKKYPLGNNNFYNGTIWGLNGAANELCFLIPNPAANAFLQPNGQFDGKYTFNQGNPVNQSKLLGQPLKNFFNGKQFTALIRGQNWSANSVIADFLYGLDHERIQVAVNATGNLVTTYYPESDTAAPIVITGTQVVTGATFKDIAISASFYGAGTDYVKQIVGGVIDGTTAINLSLPMSNDLRDLGTAILGGGFPVAPNWTVNTTNMAGLPSTLGWTWNGLATEASAMSVYGGKLYQNSNGYASTQAGYYGRITTLNNATGWVVEWKGRVVNDPNLVIDSASFIRVQDGSKDIQVLVHEYFLQIFGTGVDFTIQGDFKSAEHILTICGKGSDYYLFIDGKLAIDGTGKLLATIGTNSVYFGDGSATAGSNADAIYSYIKIYNGGMLIPTASTGASLSEFAYWSGDQSGLLPYLYNGGTPVSVKQLCGVERNYVGEGVVFSESRRGVGITSTTFTSTVPIVLQDLECYVLGSDVTLSTADSVTNTTAAQGVYGAHRTDGSLGSNLYRYEPISSSYMASCSATNKKSTYVGLHKTEAVIYVGGGTGLSLVSRLMSVTAKP